MNARVRMPATVWALGVVSLFTDIGGEMIFPLLPAFLAAMPGAGAAALGTIEGISDAVPHVLKPAIGRWSDRLKRRKPFVVLGYGITGLTRPLLGLAGNVFAVAGVRAGDRLGKGIRAAPRDALIAGSVARDRQARAFALQQAMDHTGAVIGPLLAAWLVSTGMHANRIFLLSAIPGVLAFFTLLFFVKEASFAAAETLPGGDGIKSQLDSAGVSPRIAQRLDATAPVAATPAPDAAPLPPRLRSYLVILFVFALGGSTDALLLLRAGDMGLAPALVPIAWAVLHVVKVVSNFPGGALADRFGPVRGIIAGWILYGVVYAGFAFGHGAVAAWVLFTVYGLYYGLAEGAEKVIVSRMVTPATRGRAFGMMGFASGAGTIVASFATGWLYAHVSAEWAFGTGAAAAIVAALALLAWSRGVADLSRADS